LQAAPAGTHPERLEQRSHSRIPRRLDARQPLGLLALEPGSRHERDFYPARVSFAMRGFDAAWSLS
jgi:hypothetical protein